MYEPRSALAGAYFEGPDVSIRELGPVGMITLRGDLSSPAVVGAIGGAAGVALPGIRRFSGAANDGLAWMSPDELLWICDYVDAPACASSLSAALAGERHLAAVVSDARAVFRLAGAGARELIAKGAPVDMSPASFGPCDLRRTRIGQVAVAFWLGDAGESEGFTLVCFRSVAGYVFDWLKASAKDGARPGLF